MTDTESSPRRAIRSFVLRQGRVSSAQARARDILSPRFGIPFAREALDLDAAFGRVAPKILEIGFGMGETTVAIAATHPEIDYLGIEVHTPGVGSLLKQVGEQGIGNIRIVQHDAVDVLEAMIPPASFDGVHIFFPDPWPKKRHHKRRLLQPHFVALLSTRMKPGAYLHAATDWEDYARQMLEVLSAESTLANSSRGATGFVDRPSYRPQTKFEARGLKLGHQVWDLVFRKR